MYIVVLYTTNTVYNSVLQYTRIHTINDYTARLWSLTQYPTQNTI